MTAPTRLERNLPAILGDLSAGPPPDYLDNVFGRTGRTRQRPAWTFPERWLPMADITRTRAFAPAPPWRIIAVALVVIALALAALLVVAGSQRPLPAPFGPARNGQILYDLGGEIYAADPVTGASRLLVSGPEYDTEPAYSTDGTHIAFVRSVGGAEVDYYVARDDGSDLRRITTAPLTDVAGASWTPDSRSLMVVHSVGGIRVLDLFDVAGARSPRELAAGYQPDNLAYRPPDAREILFRGFRGEQPGLYVMNADGTNIRTLVEPADLGDLHLGSLAYSSDGSRIFYQRASTAEEAAATAYPGDLCCKLWVMNADGTGAHQLANGSGQSWDGLGDPSPDGRSILFWHVTDTAHVSVMRADGTGPITDLWDVPDGNAAFAWSPDSATVMISPDGVRRDVYLVDPDSGTSSKAPWQTASGPYWQRLAP